MTEPPVLIDDIAEVPAELWAAEQASVYASPEWLAAARWPGDGVRYLVAGNALVPVRTTSRPDAWPRMNLVDICAGAPFGVPVDPALVQAARSAPSRTSSLPRPAITRYRSDCPIPT